MLCPEIWNFKPPQHSLLIEQSNQLKDSPSIIKTHYFNHSVSVVFPETIDVPEEIQSSLLRDKDYYKIHDLCPHELVSKEFIEAFVKKGELSLLAIDKKIDVHNILSIVPSGELLLSLTRETYQTLGLEGKSSFFNRNQDDTSRHVVTLDLKKECFTPGKKNYERVRNCLKNYFKETFDVIVAWDPPDNVCPSSIAAWFHKRNYKISLCHQSFVNRTRYSIDVPVVDDSCDYHQFFEWLGLFSVDGNLKNKDTKTNQSSVFASNQVQYIESTGFFTRRMVNNVYSAIKKYMGENNISWCSMDVQGFADSPISWGLKEHQFYTDGDNSYTIVFCPNGKCITRKSLSSNNKPRIFQ
ncbi:ribonuclease P protein subunit p40-like isoform X2 [Leptopilina boulardi]|uniref:ribonuclease P protein subunit p40-like isoform X2 n=1 Tax=Leptopilina boulardi TaxID=63433 RepID=UPI0021F61745|nr:ribonuclease P protein subunit p40-like isoform X2 [Leptopilina boulardi]